MRGPPEVTAAEERGALRLELRARNNRLWHLCNRSGSVAAFCRRHDLNQSEVGRLLNLKTSPWSKKTGELKKHAQRILEATGRTVFDVFDPDLYDQDVIPAETLVLEVEPSLLLQESAAADVPALGPAPDEIEDRVVVEELLHQCLETLTPREEEVIRRRFGLEPYDRPETLEAIAELLDVTRTRVSQIEGKGLRKMREPARSVPLRRAMQGEPPWPDGEGFPHTTLRQLIDPAGNRRATQLLAQGTLEQIARRSNGLVTGLEEERAAAWELEQLEEEPVVILEAEVLEEEPAEPEEVAELEPAVDLLYPDWVTRREAIIEADARRRLARDS